jgi:hypothetical protein
MDKAKIIYLLLVATNYLVSKSHLFLYSASIGIGILYLTVASSLKQFGKLVKRLRAYIEPREVSKELRLYIFHRIISQ